MSRAEKQVLSKIEKELLYGLSKVTQELRQNYSKILEYNSENPSWSEEELELLDEERKRIEKLHRELDTKLQNENDVDNGTFTQIIEEERNAEKIEEFLEKKFESGDLEFGGKNTVKLTKSLRELSNSLQVYEEGLYPNIENVEDVDERSLLAKAWDMKDVPGQKVSEKATSYSERKIIETSYGTFYFGSVGTGTDIALDLEEYGEADFLVVDSLGFDYRKNDFGDYMNNQPSAGRFDYGEVLAENIFRRKIPVLIPDVMPTRELGKLDLTIIDKLNSKVNMGAPAIGKGVLPATTALAAAGIVPVNAAVIGSITLKWQVVAPAAITTIFLPRTLTALGARAAIFCEKIDSGFASSIDKSKPTFYLNLHLKEAPLIVLFLKYPGLRKLTISLHKKAGFPGLRNSYTDVMKEIEFTQDGKKLPLSYKGEKEMTGYVEREISTGIGEVQSTSSRAKGIFSKIRSLF